MIPVSAKNPFSFWRDFCAFCNKGNEFFATCSILQIDAVQLESARREMHVRIVEARDNPLLLRIHDACLWADPFGNIG